LSAQTSLSKSNFIVVAANFLSISIHEREDEAKASDYAVFL
jgi:hypothetical protein